MRKYLIKGALALFAGTLVLGCAEKESEYVPIVEKKVKAYEEVFKEVYGDIDPYQNWGFTNDLSLADPSTTEVIYQDSVVPASARTRVAGTRTANPDANMWGRTYSNIPNPLTDAQKKRVRLYFQYNRYPTNEPVSYTNFFVQDVYKGATTPLNDGSEGKSQYSKEKYNFGGNLEAGSAHMDKLTAGYSHDHIYNYNNAHCSTNNEVWDGRTYQSGYPLTAETAAALNIGDWEAENYNHIVFHSDEIMLMENSSTACFGWNESNGSNQHDENYVIISGATIDAWAALHPELGDLGASVTGRGFVGFDYDANTTANNIFQDPNGWDEYIWNAEKNQNDIIHHNGPRTNADGVPYITSGAYDNQSSVTVVPAGTPGAYPVWERYVDGNQSKGNVWVKVGCADGYYSDWIVCIVEARGKTITSREKIEKEGEDYKIPVPAQCGRIFCEDLGESSREDLDFNDVVFDVDIYQHYEAGTRYYYTIYSDGRKVLDRTEPYSTLDRATYTAEITLQAAGGTLPLTVAEREVHSAFGVGITTMVNTRDDNSTTQGTYVNELPAVFLGTFTPSQLSPGKQDTDPIYAMDIPIVVQYENAVNELGSSLGGAPAKIFVPNHTTKWSVERKLMTLAYPKFANYVKNKNIEWWNDALLSETERQTAEYYRYSGVKYDGRVTPPIVITRITYPATTQDNLWSGSQPYTSWGLVDIALNFDKYYPGDYITFYVDNLTADAYMTVVFADGSKPYFIDTQIPNYDLDYLGKKINQGKTSAVVEVMLDEANAEKLNNSKKNGQLTIQVQGQGFTLTRIGRTLFK